MGRESPKAEEGTLPYEEGGLWSCITAVAVARVVVECHDYAEGGGVKAFILPRVLVYDFSQGFCYVFTSVFVHSLYLSSHFLILWPRSFIHFTMVVGSLLPTCLFAAWW